MTGYGIVVVAADRKAKTMPSDLQKAGMPFSLVFRCAQVFGSLSWRTLKRKAHEARN